MNRSKSSAMSDFAYMTQRFLRAEEDRFRAYKNAVALGATDKEITDIVERKRQEHLIGQARRDEANA